MSINLLIHVLYGISHCPLAEQIARWETAPFLNQYPSKQVYITELPVVKFMLTERLDRLMSGGISHTIAENTKCKYIYIYI